MDAFSALSANLVQTAPSSPSANAPTSSSSDKPFASHLQSASKQQRAGQRGATAASQTEGQVQQTPAESSTQSVADQPIVSQGEPAHRKPEPAVTDNNEAATENGGAAATLSAGQPAAPAKPTQTEASGAVGATANTVQASTISRLLDAITATTPLNGNTQQEQTTPASTTAAQQIIVESAAALPAPGLESSLPVAPAAPLLPATPSAQPTAPTSTQEQPAAAQGNMVPQSSSIVVQVIDAQNAAPLASGETSLPQSDVEPGAPLVVQNQYGQIITIQQSNALDVAAEAQAVPPATPFAGNAKADMDLTNQYIHSHLPNEAAAKGDEAENRSAMNNESGQSAPNNQSSQQPDAHSVMESMLTAKTLATPNAENQPLIFSHQQASNLTSAPLTTSTTATTDSLLHRLPSGTTVPETTVIDQMITHFSINKRLESGTVNLRLHPQELGELRMEIKVEQDNVKAHIVAQSPHAQEMIDRHLPKLREALEQQGLHLDQVEVTVATNDNATGQAFEESTTWQQSQHSMGSKQSQAVFTLEGLDEELDTTAEIDNNLSVIA